MVKVEQQPTQSKEQEPLTLKALAPDTGEVSGRDFLLRVTGAGFTENSIITFDRHNEETAINSDTEVSAVIVTAHQRTVPGDSLVTVKIGSQESEPLLFHATAPLSAEEKQRAVNATKKTPPPPPPPPPQNPQNTSAQPKEAAHSSKK